MMAISWQKYREREVLRICSLKMNKFVRSNDSNYNKITVQKYEKEQVPEIWR